MNYWWKFLKQFFFFVKHNAVPHFSHIICEYPLQFGNLHLICFSTQTGQCCIPSSRTSFTGRTCAGPFFFYFEISASHQTMMVYYHVSLQKHLALANIKLSHFLFFQNLGSFWTAKRLVSCTILPKIASVNKWQKTSNGLSKSRTFWENEVSPRNWSCWSLRNKLFFFQIISKSKRQCKNDNIVIDNA